MTDPHEDRLPKWAQKLLIEERLRAERAEHRLAEHLQTVEPTGIWYGDWQNKIYIPDPYGYQNVHFSWDGNPTKHSYDEINVSRRKGVLHINAGRSVQIKPIASNCFDIHPED